MPLKDFIAPERTIELRSKTKEAAIRELVAPSCEHAGHLDADSVADAVWEREKELDTEMVPGVAFPHARLPNVGRLVIGIGMHREGITWGPTEREPVRIIVILIGDQDRPGEHIRALAELARLFRRGATLRDLLDASTPDELYERLIAEVSTDPSALEPGQRRLTASILKHACEVARESDCRTLLILMDEDIDESLLPDRDGIEKVLLARSHPASDDPVHPYFDGALQVPFRGLAPGHRVDLALLLALTSGHIGRDDSVACAYGPPGARGVSAVSVIPIAEEFWSLLSIRPEKVTGDFEDTVMNRVLNLAVQLAGEGREGKPVGTTFVIGDYENVTEQCTQMVMNPFRGHPEEERNVLDPSLEETIKEFSSIDGAFVLRSDGVIMSAGTFIQAAAEIEGLPAGLGTRHAAGMAITAVTDALSVVISESTGTVSLFKGGRRVLALEKGLR
jgi:DNA integrity scanning protein DisA with diadenylate cyclase activity/mannitol/fructose-specific phosphotransferase system IIA component (Ntr-type)